MTSNFSNNGLPTDGFEVIHTFQETEFKKAHTAELNMLRRIFLSEDGREFKKMLANICGYDNDLFTTDPYQSAYFLGRRSVYLMLQKLIEEAVNV